MPDQTVLNAWILGGPRPPSLAGDLVLGTISWPRALGRPEGALHSAFQLKCYHYDRVEVTAEQSKFVKVPHPVSIWEGPHDEENYRVSFVTDARATRGYSPGSPDVRKDVNLLDVSFGVRVRWANNTFTGNGGKVIAPPQVTIQPPGVGQLLPPIVIGHKPISAHRDDGRVREMHPPPIA